MNNPICKVENCTGCGACINICPLKCINMVRNHEGFDYPEINLVKCIDCKKCYNVCPENFTVEFHNNNETSVYAAWNKNEKIRYNSSSGGVFSAIAEYVINQGGVVYGAAYDNNMVVRHIPVTSVKDLEKVRGSKYVQSNIGLVYKSVLQNLEEGKKVLFSGTPCQIAGLNKIIENENLYTIDILCKGVPSPKMLELYVDSEQEKVGAKIKSINFRDKKYGWGISTTKLFFKDKEYEVVNGENIHMLAFAKALTLRNCCSKCIYAKKERNSDITMGDFWGIGRTIKFNHSKKNGISLLMINSEKGKELLKNIKNEVVLEKRTLEEAVNGQGSALSKPVINNDLRNSFFQDLNNNNIDFIYYKYIRDKGLKGMFKFLIPKAVQNNIRKLLRK